MHCNTPTNPCIDSQILLTMLQATPSSSRKPLMGLIFLLNFSIFICFAPPTVTRFPPPPPLMGALAVSTGLIGALTSPQIARGA